MSTRETRSRLPRVPAATSASRANGATSTAPKRTAKAAQLDPEVDQIITRRKEKIEAFTANMNKNSLERRLQDAENARKAVEAELNKLKLDKVKLEGDRRWLAQREQELLEEREKESDAFAGEKKATTAEMKKLRDAYDRLRKQVDTLNTTNDELVVSVQQANRKNEALNSQLLALQQENEFNRSEAERYRRQASEASEQCGDLQDQLDQSIALTANTTFDISFAEDFGVTKGELSSQLSEIKTLKRENSRMRAELVVLRERDASIEVLKEEKRSLGAKAMKADRLSLEVGTLEARLEALNAEHAKCSSKGNGVPIPVQKELAALRLEHAKLVGSYTAQGELLRQRQEQFEQAEAREEERQRAVDGLKERIRLGEERVRRRERRTALAEREVEMLKGLVASYAAAEESRQAGDAQDTFDEQKDMHIANLETLIAELRAANQTLESEVDTISITRSSSGNGASNERLEALEAALKAERDRCTAADEELDRAKKELSALEAKNEKLREELWDIKPDIGRGAHLPHGVRVLELIGNPAQVWFGKREADVAKLKEENAALRELVKDGSHATHADPNAEGMVLKATLEVVQSEKAELEQTIRDKEKRLRRLQEIFAAKAEEFRAVVSCIFGYKIRFQQSGHVILTSIYDPNAVLVLSAPPKVAKGAPVPIDPTVKMQLIQTGEDAPPEVVQLYKLWVGEWNCVPGFLGSLAAQLYEATPEGVANVRGGKKTAT